jgi:DNA-directed RNA polymerase specialized sigma24 family protein
MSESAVGTAAPEPARPPDHAALTDAALLEGMARAGTCVAEAHASFAEFHRRHAGYLFAVCLRRYRGAAEEIVAETLRRVYSSASQFDRATLTAGTGPDGARRLVRAWVGRIVRWVAADHFADRKRQPPTCELGSVAEPVRPADGPGRLVDRVRGVIESLSDREQQIAWTIAHGWSPEHGRVRWSPEDLDAIAGRFGLTRDTIRQVRARLIRKLRARLEPLLDREAGAE